MADTVNLGLPIMEAGQAQKHVTHNEALRILDAVVQLNVASAALNAPPGSPADGERWIVGPVPTGAWAGRARQIAVRAQGGWLFVDPQAGWQAFNRATDAMMLFDGADWSSAGASATSAPLWGVNATADTTNRLSVNADATLFNHDGGGHQVKVNKAAIAGTASFLFQRAFSGRAEFGLIGNDDFTLKVSPDGSAFFDAMVVNRTTGRVDFPRGCLREECTVITANGTYEVPAWAGLVEITCIAGGGGGGSGRQGAAGSVRSGGGGGGSGPMVRETFLASEIATSLSVTVGAGGAGGPGASGTDSNGSAGVVGQRSFVASGGVTILTTTFGNSGAAGSSAAAAGGGAAWSDFSGGGGAGSSSTGGVGGGGGSGATAPAGGGAGGGISTANTASAGGAGGWGGRKSDVGRRGEPGTAGVVGGAGGPGGSKGWTRATGGGGGGGGGNGGAGGAGGVPGGGGGGGGASLNGTASGAGGAGGRGEVWIVARG